MRYLPSRRKREGFAQAMEAAGLARNGDHSWVEESLYTVEGGAAAARSLIGRGATAIVCGSDLMALGAIRAATELGRSVPRDISIVGFDDSALMQFLNPPLTTVRQPVQAMGSPACSASRPALVLRFCTAVCTLASKTSRARVDLPEPLTPVTATRRLSGSWAVMACRLCRLARVMVTVMKNPPN